MNLEVVARGQSCQSRLRLREDTSRPGQAKREKREHESQPSLGQGSRARGQEPATAMRAPVGDFVDLCSSWGLSLTLGLKKQLSHSHHPD